MIFDVEQARENLRKDGFHIVHDVLSPEALDGARAAVDRTISLMRDRGVPTHTAVIDPNEANVRLYNLPDCDPAFVDLLRNPIATKLVELTLGPDYILSNFTGNIALPGSLGMRIHSDQALVIPPPWNEPWAMNVIWCIDGVDEQNGATRYVPGSHAWTTFEDVPADVSERSVAFEAPAGSAIAMDGRVWHTSGANVTADARRAMLFAYYSCDFIRPQVNWEGCLSPATKATLSAAERAIYGLGPLANARLGAGLVRICEGDRPDVLAGSGMVRGR
jgi:ectoine hydroxylase-related dioxygenase (phytanoyl-CoA dioxygenase family)